MNPVPGEYFTVFKLSAGLNHTETKQQYGATATFI